jgi:cation-transporting ATPase 13A2
MSGRRSSSQQSRPGLYRHRGSNMSQVSFIGNVDMASEDIFSGPISESVPSSSIGFLHRRESIAESTAEFTYYDEEEHEGSDTWVEEGDDENDYLEEAVTDAEYGEHANGNANGQEEYETQHENGFADQDTDVEAQSQSPRRPSKRRKSSGYSRTSRTSQESGRSSKSPLLKRSDSQGSNTSGRGSRDRNSQKIYIQSEDLTIVIAGFQNSLVGTAIYLTICILTGGIGYLLFRWLPRWRVKVMGTPCALRDCTWVVVEV